MDVLESTTYGAWEEDRRYPSADGRRLIVVLKRTDGGGLTHWKNQRIPLSQADRAYYAAHPAQLDAARSIRAGR